MKMEIQDCLGVLGEENKMAEIDDKELERIRNESDERIKDDMERIELV